MDAFEMVLLFDTYGGMLTEKQCQYLDLRYNQDMSLGEIAQMQGVSRQAVFDNLTRTEMQLRHMEEKIGCLRRDRIEKAATERISEAISELRMLHDPAAARAIALMDAAVEMLRE